LKEPYYSGHEAALPPRHAVHVVLDNVRSALNVGSIFRTADAAGVACIHLCGITCWPPHPKLEKTSLGAHQYVSWQRHETTVDAVRYLQERDIPLVALETRPGAETLQTFQWPRPVALVLGHEVVGVSDEVLAASRHCLQIPMFGVKNSLNVASAFAVVVYDVVRQFNERSLRPPVG
jgi:23S rRNA (guanosine2251-2'-O)-methyltransferase